MTKTTSDFPVKDTEEVEAIKKDFCYNGKKNLKLPNLDIPLTSEQQVEVAKCFSDVVYFCNNYVKIGTITEGVQLFKTFPYQDRMLNQFVNERFNIAMLPRQMGKSTTSVGFILHYILTNPNSTIAILANKERTAIEILTRLKFAYESLPWFMKAGVIEWNKKSIVIANGEKGCKVMAAACSADSIRGESCFTGETEICVLTDNDEIFITEIQKANDIPMERVKIQKKYWIVYKTTNIVSGKFYIGCHGTNDLMDGYLGSGKLLKEDIQKYGTENFSKEILYTFDNQDDAIAKENEIISNNNYHLSESCYNMVKTISGSKVHNKAMISVVIDSIEFDSLKDAKDYLCVTTKHEILLKCGNIEEKESYFPDGAKQAEAEAYYQRWLKDKATLSERLTMLRTGVPIHTEESKEKLRQINLGLKRENPQNKDPEKIRKTAEAHRGMKRSVEARKKMSDAKKGREALNKATVFLINPETKETGYFPKDKPFPEGFIRFKKKTFHDPVSGKIICIPEGEAPPEGFLSGRPKLKKEG